MSSGRPPASPPLRSHRVAGGDSAVVVPSGGQLALNPSTMKLGGLARSTCPSPPPSGTWCLSGYNAFPVDSNDQAAAVRFASVAGSGGSYAAVVADPTVVAASRPASGPDGQEVFALTLL